MERWREGEVEGWREAESEGGKKRGREGGGGKNVKVMHVCKFLCDRDKDRRKVRKKDLWKGEDTQCGNMCRMEHEGGH